jgi:hypothetical protein
LKKTTMSDNPLIAQALKYRNQLDAASEADIQRLIDAYGALAQRLQDKIDLLVAELTANPDITTGQIARMSRYTDLLKATSAELQKYGNYLEVELGGIANNALAQSTRDALRLITIAAGGAGITGGFNHLPIDAIKTLLGFLQPDGPLYQGLQTIAPDTAQAVADGILEGVGLGYNPAKVADNIMSDLGQGLASALRLARTTPMWTYREASRANFSANSDVLDGWIWFAQLDTSVPPCGSCLANHGKQFPLDQTLDDHWNGRCAMIPHVRGDDNPVDQTGEDWFRTQNPEVQSDILGQGKLLAYLDNEFNFSQLTRQVTDPIFGTMRTEAPLKDLVSE